MRTLEHDGKHYVSLEDLKEHGFDYPEKGTKVMVRTGFFMSPYLEHQYLRFNEPREGWPGAYVSLFASEVGKVYMGDECIFWNLRQNFFNIKNNNYGNNLFKM
jgi:hypothetical protein